LAILCFEFDINRLFAAVCCKKSKRTKQKSN